MSSHSVEVRKKLIHAAVVLVAFITTAIFIAVTYPKRKAQKEARQCIQNMKFLESAAMSLCLENRWPYTRVMKPEEVAYILRGGVAPICPLGNIPYAPFDVLHGPRCPNSEAHHHSLIIDSCAGERGAVWSAALCYAAANGLSWSDTVDPGKIDVGFYEGKATGVCLLETNGYPPFVLSEGPKCPVSPEHNAQSIRVYRNREYFDAKGHALTNLPLNKVQTNDWSDWQGHEGRLQR